MPKVVNISSVVGTPPFTVYLCDNPVNVCVYIGQFTSVPYEFEIPGILEVQDDFTVRVSNSEGCSKDTIIS
jgi:hypothetical protein